MGFTRAEAVAAIAVSLVIGLVTGLGAGFIGHMVGEPIGSAFGWGGATFLGTTMFSMAAAALYLGARKTPPADSQPGTSSRGMGAP